MSRPVDLVAACEAFLAVAERGSFTVGAASLQVGQPVVSRRVATLERALGGQLLQRSARSVALTRFGQAMLPTVRRVVEATDALREQAELRRTGPLRVLLPQELGAAELGRLCARASEQGVELEVTQAAPAARAALLAEDRADLAVLPSAPDTARWRSPLGLGARPGSGRVRLDALRPGRGTTRARVLWLLPEDDVPHVRDPLERHRDRHGLSVGQLRAAPSAVTALHRVLAEDHLVLVTAADAGRLGLDWWPAPELGLTRGQVLRSDPGRRLGEAATTETLLDDVLRPAPGTEDGRRAG